jgi:hypothetical protein
LNWTPRDSFTWLSDETSNQLFLGEKHIPVWALGSTETSNKYTTWDGGSFNTSTSTYGMTAMCVRTMTGANNTGDPITSFARNPNDPVTELSNVTSVGLECRGRIMERIGDWEVTISVLLISYWATILSQYFRCDRSATSNKFDSSQRQYPANITVEKIVFSSTKLLRNK